ncbi:hypothetical protein BDN71DRAFT_1579444 [Pleurotus eryngii]|uniref:Uncharacterized protein n=1 Tax=Pleurotus eryngii TaxID=5323 RepID=A0A9P6D3S4_PLEER|nr:hypothetical protein BDN71DRAFT_1579444 [Pleurotus eryngii]
MPSESDPLFAPKCNASPSSVELNPPVGFFLCLLQKFFGAVFKNEDNSVKEAISEEFDRLEKERENKTEDPTSLSHIRTIFIHHGKNHAGIAFSDATPNFLEQITWPYDTFLNSVYTSAECASHALFQGADAAAASPVHTATTITSETPTIILHSSYHPAIGDYNYNFPWNELNLLNPINPLKQLNLLNANMGSNMATAFGEFGSFYEQLMAPLPKHMYNQLLTGPIGPNVPFTPTTAVIPPFSNQYH